MHVNIRSRTLELEMASSLSFAILHIVFLFYLIDAPLTQSAPIQLKGQHVTVSASIF